MSQTKDQISHLEVLQIPIFVTIQFSVDSFPTHGLLDNVIVVRCVILRHRVLENVEAIETKRTEIVA